MKIRSVRDLVAVLRGRRTDQGWSQQRLADAAGVSRSWLANLELGKPSAEVSRLLALFESLGLTLEISGPQSDDGDRDGDGDGDRSLRTGRIDLDEHLRRYEP